jgi:hypothetical protein
LFILGIAELIIVRGLAKEVIITRLPVGHTHEDIDSKFAVIWMRLRKSYVLTPMKYKDAIEDCLSTTKIKCTVHDIFVVPDYANYLKPYIDRNLGR